MQGEDVVKGLHMLHGEEQNCTPAATADLVLKAP